MYALFKRDAKVYAAVRNKKESRTAIRELLVTSGGYARSDDGDEFGKELAFFFLPILFPKFN